MKNIVATRIVLLCLFQWFVSTGVQAVSVNASTGLSFPAPPGGTSFDDSDFQLLSSPGAIATANSDITAGYLPLSTVIEGHATATASANDLKAGVTLSISDFDTSIRGEGIFLNASAGLSGFYTASSLVDVFASPVFSLGGALSSSTDSFTSRVRLFSSQLGGTLFTQTGTPSLAIIDEIIVPAPILLSGTTFMSFSLSTAVDSTGLPLTAGSHSAVVDFSGTLDLLGFALFEDAAMTMPILDRVTVTSDDGASIPVIAVPTLNPIPLPAAVWLFGTALVGLLGFSRRKSNN